MTKIGLISDSHGRAAITRRAVRMLIDRGIDTILHLGDIGSETVIDALLEGLDDEGNPSPEIRLVFGNSDIDARSLGNYARSLGIGVEDPAGRLHVDGRILVFTHGHLPAAVKEALAEDVDYLLHGHSHRQRDERIGSTRVINPGALHRAAHYSAAILEPEADRLTFIEVPRE